MNVTATRPPALFLYDGHCGFCNSSVQWLLARDKHDRFRFSPQQSPLAEAILRRHNIDRAKVISDNSVYLVLGLNSPQERLLTRSDVSVEALRVLGGFWKLLGRLLAIAPKSVRDAAYTLVARNRYRLGGRFDSCPVPSLAQQTKFLG